MSDESPTFADAWNLREPPDPSGELHLSAEINCGACNAWWTAFVESRAQAARMARNRGWRMNEWDGWLCPGCVKRLKAERKEQSKRKE